MPFWIELIAGLLSFAIAAASGKMLIPFLHKLKFGQPIKVEFGPKWHEGKQGTPTMGGIMFILSSAVAVSVGYAVYRMTSSVTLGDESVFASKAALRLFSCIVFCILFGVMGFIDDFTKVARKKNDGLSPMQKIVIQIVIAAAWLFTMRYLGDTDTSIDLEFVSFDIGWFYYPLMIVVILYLTNAVNLTDGIDGLCGTVTMVNMLLYTVVFVLLSNAEMTLFTISIAGGCLGFLVWNFHPAKCFMGDTGSMFLGAAVTAAGLVTHRHLVLVLLALVYIIEALSVVIQVSYFKYTKKKYGEGRRIFKMTPIHHHFEMSGFSEYKIVITFSLFSLIVGIPGVLLVLFR
ncbi:MAG: phospho-N-acetylmuramoyl-pentapeptide-transferase [Oscillospiraceae bacterium]|nr:phospho-N-acetylmuramoyl-pentapeptide-transferase [Oscillospiraceae bacterium]